MEMIGFTAITKFNRGMYDDPAPSKSIDILCLDVFIGVDFHTSFARSLEG